MVLIRTSLFIFLFSVVDVLGQSVDDSYAAAEARLKSRAQISKPLHSTSIKSPAATQPIQLSDGKFTDINLAQLREQLSKLIEDSIKLDRLSIKSVMDKATKDRVILHINAEQKVKEQVATITDSDLINLVRIFDQQQKSYVDSRAKYDALPNPDPGPFSSPKSAADLYIKEFLDQGTFVSSKFIGYLKAGRVADISPEELKTFKGDIVYNTTYVTKSGLLRNGDIKVLVFNNNHNAWIPLSITDGTTQLAGLDVEISQKFNKITAKPPAPHAPCIAWDGKKLTVTNSINFDQGDTVGPIIPELENGKNRRPDLVNLLIN